MYPQVLRHYKLQPPPDGVPLGPWVEALPAHILRATSRTCPSLPRQFTTVGECLRDMAVKSDAATKEIEDGEYQMIPCPKPSTLILIDWLLESDHEFGAVYLEKAPLSAGERTQNNPLRVRLSASRERDGKRWVHLSCRRERSLPSYADLCRVKKTFLGEEAMAYQLFPPRSQHVNDNAAVLHLWHCLDGDVTPDFRKGGTI